jgi:hypothetical protein
VQTLVAAGLLVASLAVVAVLVWNDTPDAPAGEHALLVLGPHGAIFDGTGVGATPYAVLLQAAAGNFEVESQGKGDTAFVTAIDGQRNQGAAGWCYAVDAGDGWVYPQVGAGAYGLPPGVRVLWTYQSQGCP